MVQKAFREFLVTKNENIAALTKTWMSYEGHHIIVRTCLCTYVHVFARKNYIYQFNFNSNIILRVIICIMIRISKLFHIKIISIFSLYFLLPLHFYLHSSPPPIFLFFLQQLYKAAQERYKDSLISSHIIVYRNGIRRHSAPTTFFNSVNNTRRNELSLIKSNTEVSLFFSPCIAYLTSNDQVKCLFLILPLFIHLFIQLFIQFVIHLPTSLLIHSFT